MTGRIDHARVHRLEERRQRLLDMLHAHGGNPFLVRQIADTQIELMYVREGQEPPRRLGGHHG